jgi:hypothetical protein
MMAATLVGFTGFALRAQPPELLPLPPQWDAVFTLRAGGGYKDNVFLSHADPRPSAFLSAGAEAMALRLAPQGPQLTFFASADGRRFLSRHVEHTEYVAFSQVQLEHDFNQTFEGSFSAQYFYQDQVLDVSVSETNRQAVAARGHTLTLRPAIRVALPQRSWLSVEPSVTRQYFEDPLDDYWEAGPKITVGRTYGHASQISLSYEPWWRFYDTDPARTTTGAAILGSHRQRIQNEGRLTWRHNWDEQKHWRTAATVGTRLNKENGEGFSDYTRWFMTARIVYRATPWEISTEARLGQYEYDTQTVSAADLSKRRRTEWLAVVNLQRELIKGLKIMASYEYEETRSNDQLETYTVNTLSGSLQWEF